jgi:hypothetical protein
MEASLKTVRIVWIAMLVATFIYLLLPEMLNLNPRDLNSPIYAVFVALVVVVLTSIVILRMLTIGRAEPLIRANSNDAGALQKWRAGQIVTVALCEAIVLYGLVLRFVGATWAQSAPFYGVGIAAMIVFWPKPVR